MSTEQQWMPTPGEEYPAFVHQDMTMTIYADEHERDVAEAEFHDQIPPDENGLPTAALLPLGVPVTVRISADGCSAEILDGLLHGVQSVRVHAPHELN